jgi:uncharacterized membrane protein
LQARPITITPSKGGTMRHVVKNLSLALALTALAVGGISAAESVTIPDTGLDIGEYITAAITTVAGVFAVVVGGYFAFLIVKKAMRWAGRALG